MKYDVLKDVVVDGKAYAAGATVEIHHDKVDRLILLGFLAPQDAPKRRGRPPKVERDEILGD